LETPKSKGKQFSLEKKNQETFACFNGRSAGDMIALAQRKVFCFFFSKEKYFLL
jgi:hypothetical protein